MTTCSSETSKLIKKKKVKHSQPCEIQQRNRKCWKPVKYTRHFYILCHLTSYFTISLFSFSLQCSELPYNQLKDKLKVETVELSYDLTTKRRKETKSSSCLIHKFLTLFNFEDLESCFIFPLCFSCKYNLFERKKISLVSLRCL